MKVIWARNVHEALPKGIDYLLGRGISRESRNGAVLVSPVPVSTRYERPMERLSFWSGRPINAAFLLAEALWMLCGRRDVEPLKSFISGFERYSDDGKVLHGAYGYRWRRAFGFDQLDVIAKRLEADENDRRCVLQMWSAEDDLGVQSLDLPCNTMATFQVVIDEEGGESLDLVVFCRSNDILWGAYFANAFHFGFLLDYMALRTGYRVGTYTQVSVNYHAYANVLDEFKPIRDEALSRVYASPAAIDNPYADGRVHPWMGANSHDEIDRAAEELMVHVSTGFALPVIETSEFFNVAYGILRSGFLLKTIKTPGRFDQAALALASLPPTLDLVVAQKRWIESLKAKAEQKAAS